MLSQINIQALKAANLCASTEQTRYYLVGVLLAIAPRSSIYVATNGHILLAHNSSLTKEADANTLLGEWIIPSATIAKLKARGDAPGTIAALDGGRLVITDADGVEHITKPVDGSFPDWRRVLPSAVDAAAPVERTQFDPAYVAVFGKVAKLFGIESKYVSIHFSKSGDPAAVTFGGGAIDTFGVIMPVRGTAELWAGAPTWVNSQPAAAAEAAE